MISPGGDDGDDVAGKGLNVEPSNALSNSLMAAPRW
jgi:hypothetical protein